MLDIKLLESDAVHEDSQRTFLDLYKESLKNRGGDLSLLDKVLDLNKKRKELILIAEQSRHHQKQVSEQIAQMKQNNEDATDLIKEMGALSQKVKAKTKESDECIEELSGLLAGLPNLCHASIPVGSDEANNKLIKNVGELKKFKFKPKDHVDIGESLGVLDFERASKVTGSRFCFSKGIAARMQRSLVQFMMDVHSNNHGYTEIIPPYIVSDKSLFGTGQFPKFKEDVFGLSDTNYYLIPTAEVPVTNLYADEILPESSLPQSFVAYSPCFRSEAGSYGQDTKGLIRQHQFEKIELLKFVRPEESFEELEALTGHAERILEILELPYRVMSLCTGDIGFGATKCYDLEVWLPGQNKYREISSCSNFGDFQARRANIRFRDGKKPRFVHTLNGSGLAIGRTLLAILENYQNEDGSVTVPHALQKYMGVSTISLSD